MSAGRQAFTESDLPEYSNFVLFKLMTRFTVTCNLYLTVLSPGREVLPFLLTFIVHLKVKMLTYQADALDKDLMNLCD